MRIKMHLLGISVTVLLSVYAVTAYAGQGIRERQEGEADIAEPELRYPEPDGNQGYYKTNPYIYIYHKQADAVTKYEFLAADNTKKTGSLELMEGQTEECYYLAEENFKDGENILRVWMERKSAEPDEGEEEPPGENETGGSGTEGNETGGNKSEDNGTGENESEGNGVDINESEEYDTENNVSGSHDAEESESGKQESEEQIAEQSASADENVSPAEPEIVFEKEIHFLLDTKKPRKVRFSYDSAIREGSIFTNETVQLTVSSEDEGSGIESICYKTGDGSIGVLPGNSGIISLASGFDGTVEAYAVDKAGNQSEPAVSERILSENTPPTIWIEAENGTDTWYSESVKLSVKVSDDSLSSGLRSLKCYAGGEMLTQKENDYNTGVTNMEAGFTVDIPSRKEEEFPWLRKHRTGQVTTIRKAN